MLLEIDVEDCELVTAEVDFLPQFLLHFLVHHQTVICPVQFAQGLNFNSNPMQISH